MILWEQYGLTSPPGDVYHPTAGWWLLVTSLDETSLVSPGTILICLENLRTLVEFDNSFCFVYLIYFAENSIFNIGYSY